MRQASQAFCTAVQHACAQEPAQPEASTSGRCHQDLSGVSLDEHIAAVLSAHRRQCGEVQARHAQEAPQQQQQGDGEADLPCTKRAAILQVQLILSLYNRLARKMWVTLALST